MKHFLLFAVIFLSGFGAASVRADGENTTLGTCNHIFYNNAGLDNQQTTMGACFADLVAIRTASTSSPLGLYDGGPWLAPHATNTVYEWRYSVGGRYTTWATPGKTFTPCQAGYLFDALTTTCYPDPTIDPCPPGQISGPGGICTTDPDPDETPCKNILGYVNGVEVCQDQKDECEAQGGSYGIIMDEEGCLVGEEDPDKECASEMYIFGNEYGGYVCVHPDETNPNDDTPDPGVECPAGYTLSGNSCVTTNTDPGGDDDDDGVPNSDDDDRDGDGVDNARDPDRGVGQCDPTSVAYAECVGQMTQVSNTAAADIRSAVNRGGASALDGVVSGVKSAIGSGNAGMGQPTDVVEELTGFSGFNPGSCSDIAFEVFAHPMAIECGETQRLRDVLSWVFAFLTLVYIVNLALQRSA